MNDTNFRKLLAFLRRRFPVDPQQGKIHVRRRKTAGGMHGLTTFSNLHAGVIRFRIRIESGITPTETTDSVIHEMAHVYAILDACFHPDSPLTYGQWRERLYAAWEKSNLTE